MEFRVLNLFLFSLLILHLTSELSREKRAPFFLKLNSHRYPENLSRFPQVPASCMWWV